MIALLHVAAPGAAFKCFTQGGPLQAASGRQGPRSGLRSSREGRGSADGWGVAGCPRRMGEEETTAFCWLDRGESLFPGQMTLLLLLRGTLLLEDELEKKDEKLQKVKKGH
jgi:hypothetical protein